MTPAPRRGVMARWRRDRAGNVALIFTLLLPALLLTVLGAIELNQVLADKRRTQDVADAAALMGAGQLGTTPYGADQRAKAYALAQLGDVATHASVTATATIGPTSKTGATLTVTVDTQRPSFFGDLLPPGGFHTHVTATAQGVSTAPLCVLGIANTGGDEIKAAGTSQLQAGQCLVHSNSALATDPGASILADDNEAGTTATGVINAPANLSAPPIADPFAALSVNAQCTNALAAQTLTLATSVLTQSVAAGVHGPLTLTGPNPSGLVGSVTGAVGLNTPVNVTFSPGEHDFCGDLTVSGDVAITGKDVVLVFAKGASLKVTGAATLSFFGRQSGPLAGFVMIADRTYQGAFTIPSDNVVALTGTVYAPTSTLAITGTKASGQNTPWTVIDAENLQLQGAVQLVINANYNASDVPVPRGVGPGWSNGSQLTQ